MAACADLHKLARAMCSVDLAESQWTQELPRLPVPDLWLTISRYLASLRAVLAPCERLDELERQLGNKLTRAQLEANLRQFERTEALVKQFMLTEGPELQRDLKEHANRCQNWATDFWLQDMYLSNAAPLPVNSNPFFLFPRQHFASSNEMLMFATRIIQFSVDFKFRIDQQALKQDFGSGHGKGKALCMETYKNFFHSYRMPHEDMDRLLPQSRRSNHIVVASCDQFYVLRLGQDPLDNPYRRDASSQLNEASIFEQLLRIYRVSREHARRAAPGAAESRAALPQVGLFTSENRKRWARLHKRLSQCGGCGDSSQSGGRSSSLGSGSSSPTSNTESLRLIEDCLFVMCLDSLVEGHHSRSQSHSHSHSHSDLQPRPQPPEESPSEQVRAATVILTGGGSRLFSANRWFDKFLQIIVGRDGVCGINIEHSASEGITVLRFLEEFLAFIRANPLASSVRRLSQQQQQSATCAGAASRARLEDLQEGDVLEPPQPQPQPQPQSERPLKQVFEFGAGAQPNSAESSISSPGYVEPKSPSALLEESDKITPLVWTLDANLHDALDEARAHADALNENFSLVILNFDHFGRAFIKAQSLSPDAFVQLALQYTFYKLHGRLVSTYESASLRQFRLGRVDNIRANTCEAHAWIQQMLACKQQQQRRSEPAEGQTANEPTECAQNFQAAEGAFIRAITKQVEILRYTIGGSAPDNHLLALRQLAKLRYGPQPEEAPELFREPSYGEFLNFRLSTSQLPNESGITVGYGAVVHDGYGCSYNPCEARVVFCVSSFADNPDTSSSRFASALEESLLEMQQLCLGRAAAAATPAAATAAAKAPIK